MSFDQTLSRTRGRRRALHLPRIPLRFVVAALLLAAALAGGWMWLRDSELVRVRDVRVIGTSSPAEARIRGALEVTARTMTTLHVREEALQRAVRSFPSVAALRVRPDVPHGLLIEVLERRPAALVTSGDMRLAATGSGLLLRDIGAPEGLPEIALDGPVAGTKVGDRRVLAALAVAAAAPEPLRERTTRISFGPRGITAELANGPPLIFGNPQDASSKWAAAARVLSDPSAAGATYLDLRVTGRVAAGGLGPIVAETAETAETAAPPGTAPSLSPTPAPTVAATPTPQPQP
jgi:cell division protein FtsQ